MIEFRPYLPADLEWLDLQGAQTYLQATLGDPDYRRELVSRDSWTVTVDGRAAGSGGLAMLEPWRAIAWMLIGREIPPFAWVAIRRQCATVMQHARARGITRIEAEVPLTFQSGHRFAMLLGFAFEGLAPGRGLNRETYARYATVYDASDQLPNRYRALLTMAHETIFADPPPSRPGGPARSLGGIYNDRH